MMPMTYYTVTVIIISGALAAMLDLGKGSGPLDHGYGFQQMLRCEKRQVKNTCLLLYYCSFKISFGVQSR